MVASFSLLLLSLVFENTLALNYYRYTAYRDAVKNGIVQGSLPQIYEFYTDYDLVASTSPSLLKDASNYGLNQIDLYNSSGLWLKGNADGLPSNQYIILNVKLPGPITDVCGIVLGSKSNDASSMPAGYMFQWRSNSSMAFRTLNDQNSGAQLFTSLQTAPTDKGVYIIDSVPANEFNIAIFSRPNGTISVKLAFMNSCVWQNTIDITDCGEIVMGNPRFMTLPIGKPISIRCPNNCIQERPCWGYRVYSYDSPICWVMQQNFGTVGGGLRTLYRIQTAPFFNDQIDPNLNNRIYCRSYMQPYPAITFEKNVEVLVNAQYQQMYPLGSGGISSLP